MSGTDGRDCERDGRTGLFPPGEALPPQSSRPSVPPVSPAAQPPPQGSCTGAQVLSGLYRVILRNSSTDAAPRSFS